MVESFTPPLLTASVAILDIASSVCPVTLDKKAAAFTVVVWYCPTIEPYETQYNTIQYITIQWICITSFEKFVYSGIKIKIKTHLHTGTYMYTDIKYYNNNSTVLEYEVRKSIAA